MFMFVCMFLSFLLSFIKLSARTTLINTVLVFIFEIYCYFWQSKVTLPS